MLRPVTPADTDALVELTGGTGFFKPHELDTLREVLDDFHATNRDLGHRAFAWDEAGRTLGYVYHTPRPRGPTDRGTCTGSRWGRTSRAAGSVAGSWSSSKTTCGSSPAGCS
ncbi:MAG TPA: hypothetical protein VKE74_10235 [Gemmataceae bacterium]|nr:hypothetical protein [Gemmataceae bacterium]